MNIKKFSRIFIIIGLSIFIFINNSCETPTKLFSWFDSTYNGGYIDNILVLAVVKDLEYKNAYENEIVKILSKRGIHSIESSKILSTNKSYSQEDFDSIISENNLNFILIVKYLGTEIEKVDAKGRTFYKYYKKTLKSTLRQGYYEIHRTVVVEVSLFSASNQKIIWLATAKTTNAYDINDLANSLAKEIINNLEGKKLINRIKNN
ncbi:MAG: hypothetical protein N2490_02480 [Ignavibacteria bacterium]|nr:hypothetical protein [Ignavibacteria bacterium]